MPFLQSLHYFRALSIVLIVGSLAIMLARGGLNLGVDFAGGTLIQIKFQKDTKPDEIRSGGRVGQWSNASSADSRR